MKSVAFPHEKTTSPVFSWNHEKAASAQTDHLHLRDLECTLFTRSFGQVRRTMSCSVMFEEYRWQRHYWDLCLLDLQAFMTIVTELLLQSTFNERGRRKGRGVLF